MKPAYMKQALPPLAQQCGGSTARQTVAGLVCCQEQLHIRSITSGRRNEQMRWLGHVTGIAVDAISVHANLEKP